MGAPWREAGSREQPVETVEREMREELGMRVRPVTPIHAYRHVIPGSPDERNGVLVISYLSERLAATGDLELVGEAGKAGFGRFSIDELTHLKIPAFYCEAINSAYAAEAKGWAKA